MDTNKILDIVKEKIVAESKKYKVHCFKIDENKYGGYINFPNENYLQDKCNEFLLLVDKKNLQPRKIRRYKEIENCTEEILTPFFNHNMKIKSVDNDEYYDENKVIISYDDDEVFDEVVLRIYRDIMEYAKNCYREELKKA